MPPRPKELRYWTCAATMYREEQRAAHHVEKLGFDYYFAGCRAAASLAAGLRCSGVATWIVVALA